MAILDARDGAGDTTVHAREREAVRHKPFESSVSLGVVRGFVGAVERAGASRDVLQRATSLNLDQLDGEGRLPRSELLRIFDAALEATGDPALGLHCIQRISPVSYGPLAHLIAHSATLGDALDGLARFHRLLNDEPSFEVVQQSDEVVLSKTLHPEDPPRIQRLTAEMSMLGLFRVVRIFAGSPPEAASFTYAAPPYEAEYARVFEGRARFGQAFTGIVFDKA